MKISYHEMTKADSQSRKQVSNREWEISVHIYMTWFNESFGCHKKRSELDVVEQKSESAPYEGQALMIKINKAQFLFLYTLWRYSYRILTRLCLCYAKTMFMLCLCPKHNPNIVKLLIAAQKQKGIIIMGKYLEDHINWSLCRNQTMNRNWNYRKGKSVKVP